MSTRRTPPPLSPLMTPDEASESLGITIGELLTMGRHNLGPEFYILGRRLIRYNRVDVERNIPEDVPGESSCAPL